MSIIGIDVSHFNGTIDWHAATESISFAFAKATQGTGFTDPCFHANWKAMKQADVPRGAYHFFDPLKDAVAQANFFLGTVQLDNNDLPPALDVEVSMGANRANVAVGVRRWLERVEDVTSKTPMVYTSANFWTQLGNPAKPGEYPLWTSHYGVKTPRIPASWGEWLFWQFTQAGRCSGIEGYVDLNRFSGSLEDLRALTIPAGKRATLVA